jgi:oligosaccharyltransferase complex subunit gamma
MEPLDVLASCLFSNDQITQVVYITCTSGIIYDIIHDVPFTGRDPKTGETIIFAGANREQYGLEGWIVSISIMLVGVLFVGIILVGHKLPERYSALAGGVALFLICFVVTQLEKVYKDKSWYGPSFSPPSGYIRGPLSRDQGNNI